MSQNRSASNQDRDESYQNAARGNRNGLQNYPSGSMPNRSDNHPNLNPNYQNPVDLIRNYNRDRQPQEPEENIYERLDNDEDIVDNEHDLSNNLSNSRNDRNSPDHHTYERIDNRPWYRGGTNYRGGNGSYFSNFPGSSTINDMDPRHLGQYDAPRNVYLDSSRGLSNQPYLGRLNRLGRNCFSTDNIACASNKRYVYQMGHNCMCQFCRHLDARYICHYCHNSHDRLYYYDAGNVGTLGSARHYIYQVTRSCRCTFCRGEFPYARFPIGSTRLSDTFRRDCHCRNPSSCICNRSRFLSYSNPAIYIGRIDRPGVGQSVNNLLYGNPTIYVGRLERSCVTGLSNLSGSTDPTPSTSNPASSAGASDQGPSSSRSNLNISANPSTSSASVCPMNRVSDRQHTCDDSCIRNQSGHGGSIYQLLGRCEKADCHHGRVSVHWLFVNKGLSSRGPSGSERNPDMVPRKDEHLEQPESDSDES